MNLEKLEESLPNMPDKALFRFVKRCVCQAVLGLSDSASQAKAALDIVYLECQRRGKERLYDMAFELVNRHPERCQIR